jgi:hypothetical protein
MGMPAISGTVTYGKPLVDGLASMPSVVVAFSQAVIDKTYLTWLDVSKLLEAFPEHVQVLGDTVTFQGPVAIISSVNPTYRLFAKCVLGLASVALYRLFIRAMTPKQKNQLTSSVQVKNKGQIAIIRIFFSYAFFGLGFYLADRFLPTQAGVHFYGLPPYPLLSNIEA